MDEQPVAGEEHGRTWRTAAYLGLVQPEHPRPRTPFSWGKVGRATLEVAPVVVGVSLFGQVRWYVLVPVLLVVLIGTQIGLSLWDLRKGRHARR